MSARPLRLAWQAALIVSLATLLPRAICSRDAGGFFHDDPETVRALADVVAQRASRGITPRDLHTGSAQFDGEWALVENQMAVLGMGQHLLRHPEDGPRYLPAIRAAVRALQLPEARAFGTKLWGEDGFATLDGENGHVYLGYLAMGLGMARLVDPETTQEVKELDDRLCAALERRLAASPHGLIETFPGTTFPADVSSAIGAIGLHARATQRREVPFLRSWSQTFRKRWVDERTGFAFQTGDPRTGRATSSGRGSGTALIVYHLSFADAALARSLDASVAKHGFTEFVGFGGIREYPEGVAGQGDIDSGPVVFGVSVSATGFGLSGAKLFGDEPRFTALSRTAFLFGAPATHGAGRSYLAGSGLGDAILLAMMSAGPGMAAR